MNLVDTVSVGDTFIYEDVNGLYPDLDGKEVKIVGYWEGVPFPIYVTDDLTVEPVFDNFNQASRDSFGAVEVSPFAENEVPNFRF